MRRAVAFAPGHISGFFQPITDFDDIDKIGSRGAGVCIAHGATAQVELQKSRKQKINIFINGKIGTYSVTRTAVKYLLGKENLEINVNISLDLPGSHGFGMSAAGALSSSLALVQLLDKPHLKAVEAAHRAEVIHHTGLGDVCSSALGGFEIRKKPGIQPYGDIQKISEKHSILLAVFPGEMSTKSILTNDRYIQQISNIGSFCTDKVIESPSIELIMKYSYYFTEKSGLAPKNILHVLDKIRVEHRASMCMLGHSIFVLDYNEKVKQLLLEESMIIETRVDNKGARIIHDI
jgi:pantoate kinase